MKLHEYQSKVILSRYGVPIPKGRVALSASEAKQIAAELGGRVVIKSQVLVGSRGKAGGIRLAKSLKEVEELATAILSMEIKGLPVRKVLVDEAVSIAEELYLSITDDRTTGRPVLIASGDGGIDIETIAEQSPEKIVRVSIDPLLGLKEYQSRNVAVSIELPRDLWRPFSQITQGLWQAYIENNLQLAEINPLVITEDQRLMALDAKLIVDDNALFRRTELADLRDMDAEDPVEIEARKYGLSYIKLDGEIGCMVNGAGLAMATMDIIKLYGGNPANFLDIGGGASAEKVAAAFRIILTDANIRAVLINIFGGITRCDEVAKGILSVMAEMKLHVPMVVRLVGTNAEEGARLLADAHMITATTLVDAAQKAVQVALESQK
ncbi:MAG: ADP-forming succinate--CoA ligase subunit beta [Chloroflexi bacterium]|nr:ADP-forming succinate--CoA ligase subunit beta [Chloroflexota bacterium]